MATLEVEGISKSILTKKLRDTIDELLGITHPLVIQVPIGKSVFLRVLGNTYRRAYHTLAAIHKLSDDEMSAGSISILSRSLIEDGVSIEYMLATDKEKKAERFRDFYYMQAKEDNDYIKQQGLANLPGIKETLDEINVNYDAIKKDFLRPDGFKMRTWDNKDVDAMLREIAKIKSPFFSPEQVKGVARAYLLGSRKTHFNPIDLTIYFDDAAMKVDREHTLMGSLAIAISVYVRLTTRYRDEVSANAKKNLYTEIGQRANELLQELDNN